MSDVNIPPEGSLWVWSKPGVEKVEMAIVVACFESKRVSGEPCNMLRLYVTQSRNNPLFYDAKLSEIPLSRWLFNLTFMSRVS